MASKEDILPGDDELEAKEAAKSGSLTTMIFLFLCVVFMVLSISVNWTNQIFNPVVWMASYSKLWVIFALPYLAIRNGPTN